ncbi:MAG: hypothetical protein A2020_13210 [Lentisphaerae bacterium GWF2_45_14]|nr:MAG: hypothetical protein A2020_13210 [Lentisphaerae bacterium GWF2_45_14]
MEFQIQSGTSVSAENNIGLVYKIAYELKRLPLPQEDLVSEGCMGLMKAADKYNPARGTTFSSYAACWIKQSMYRAAEKYGSEIRVPSWTLSRIRHARKLKATEKHEHNAKSMTDSEIEKYLNIGENSRTISIYEKTGNDGTILESLKSGRENLPDFELAMNERSAIIMGSLERLDEREKAIIKMYFGLSSEKALTHLEISKALGISRERVRQLQHEAIIKMRTDLKNVKDIFSD